VRSISIRGPSWVTRRPGLTVAMAVLLTLLALSRLVDVRTGEPRLLLDPSVDSMLPADSEARHFYDRVRETFGSDEQLVVALGSDDAFDPERLQRLGRMAAEIDAIDGVRRVRSVSALLPDPIPEDPVHLAALRDTLLSNPLVAGSLVSRDGRTLALVIELDDLTEQEVFDRGLDLEIERVAHASKAEDSLWITGGAHIKAEMTRALMRDLTLIVPVAVLVMAAVGFACFRTGRGVAVPLSTVGISTTLLLAIMADVSGSLNQVTVAVPPILIVVGFAYSIHILSAYYSAIRDGARGSDAVRHGLDRVALAMVLTGATTCAGFASLATSSLAAIQQFGLYTALGVFLTTIASLTYAPALLAILPEPTRVPAESTNQRFDSLVERLARMDVVHRRRILWAGAAIAGLSLVGMTQITVNTDLIRNFDEEARVRVDFEAVNSKLDGANAFYVVVEGPEVRSIDRDRTLRVIQELQQWLTSRPQIGGTTSIVDYLQATHTATGGTGNVIDAIESGAQVATLLDAVPREALATVVDSKYRLANIVVRTSAVDSAEIVRLVEEIEDHLGRLPRIVEATVTGNAILMSQTLDEIALGQALSLGTAFVIILAILVLLFTSFRVGLTALVPNALPVLFYFGMLGLTGIDLNTTTGLVAALVLGIAVDDTIHYMAQFNTASKRHADTRRGVVEALRSVVRPVSYTTASLCLGFSTLMLSSLQNQVQFGLLAATTLAFAWLVDVTLTPALAARMRVVTLWDILTLDIGPQPHLAIPLFAGLRETQARVVALLARLQHVHRGHRLMARGAEGETMYIVIDGELEISIPRNGEAHALQVAGRGDMLGEAALFHGRRIADAVALTDAKLLLYGEDELAQLRERYPRIAAHVYHNMSRILTLQLTQVTHLAGTPSESKSA
jgi:predicted RND superfamily exporter protein